MRRHLTRALLAFGVTSSAALAQPHAPSPPLSDEFLINSAMLAAPLAVADAATIITVGSDGATRTLRRGTNTFTCMPDNPRTPGLDPMCMDGNALAWVQAWMARKEPPQGKVGFLYMLAGGTDASNTDPFAQKPEPNNNWIETGPHVMIVGAKGLMDGYPRKARPDISQPYVMWPDTPYEHLMIPVQSSAPVTAFK